MVMIGVIAVGLAVALGFAFRLGWELCSWCL